MKWLIVIGMMFPTFDIDRENVIILSEIDNKPAEFKSKKECVSYARNNWNNLIAFAMREFYNEKGVVRGIACVSNKELEKNKSHSI